VTIGDAVRQVRAHTDLRTGVGDDRQAALDARRRLVMVDDGGGPALQRLHRAEHGRPVDHLGVQRNVETPPHLLEDLEEGSRLVRRRRHAASQRRVQVVVAADHARGDGAHRPAR
jgi:hypothetical protein